MIAQVVFIDYDSGGNRVGVIKLTFIYFFYLKWNKRILFISWRRKSAFLSAREGWNWIGIIWRFNHKLYKSPILRSTYTCFPSSLLQCHFLQTLSINMVVFIFDLSTDYKCEGEWILYFEMNWKFWVYSGEEGELLIEKKWV